MCCDFGKQQFYLKNALVIEQLVAVDTLDKTGTITTIKSNVLYEGEVLRRKYKVIKKCSERFKPSVRVECYTFTKYRKIKLTHFQEITGQGILATINGVVVQIGSGTCISTAENDNLLTTVHIKIGGEYVGRFLFYESVP
jgi:Cu+-exporting ATPase